jgi:hypothetical protein
MNQGRVRTINHGTQVNDYQMTTKEQMINGKAKNPRNTFQVLKKDVINKTELLHDFANQLLEHAYR